MQIAGIIKWRLNNKAARVRQQAADLIGRVAVVLKQCGCVFFLFSFVFHKSQQHNPIRTQTREHTHKTNTNREEEKLCHLGVVLYEYLGEEYPEVLGSILGGLKAIVNVIGMEKMTPPIKVLFAASVFLRCVSRFCFRFSVSLGSVLPSP